MHMATTPQDKDRLNDIVTEARRHRQQLQNSYRERAFKLFPKICARCGREFSGKRLKELTVHHRDHNHDNNPPDGSNWELLCLYCHENEHSRHAVAEAYDNKSSISADPPADYDNKPFAGLEELLKKRQNKDK